MQFILHKSGWLSATAFGLLILSLMVVMAVSSPTGQETRALAEQSQPTYSLALPTIMAPVIRKEVREEPQEEVAYCNTNRLQLPTALFRIISALL